MNNKQPNSRSCFLCGRQNPIGLKMSWYNDHDKNEVWSKVTIPDTFNSYPGFVHGGIISAVLDETSGRAVLIDGDKDNLMITTRLEVKFLQPTPTEQQLTVIGKIVNGNKRRAHVYGEIRLDDGTITAKCNATIIRPPEKVRATWKWDQEEDDWKVYED